MDENKEYYAFISYKREDEKWAKWLQHKLEHYKFPTSLNGRTDLPKKIYPTFRDVTDMSPEPLEQAINKALNNSQWLIVVCSPRSAKSPWVCKEAQSFIDQGREDHIIPFIIDGIPFSNNQSTECFPESILNLRGSRELLAANIKDSLGRYAAVVKIVARMFNLNFESLWKRIEREKRRQHFVIYCIVLLMTVLFASVAKYIWNQNVVKREMRINQSKNIAEKVNQLVEEGDAYTATLLALEVLSDKYPYTIEAGYALLNASIHNTAVISDYGSHAIISPDDKYIASFLGNSVYLLDAYSGGYIRSMQLNNEITSIAFSPDGKYIAGGCHLGFFVWNINNEVFITPKSFNRRVNSIVYSRKGDVLITASSDSTISVWDASTLKDLRVIQNQDYVRDVTCSPDGRYAAYRCGKLIKLLDVNNLTIKDSIFIDNKLGWGPDKISFYNSDTLVYSILNNSYVRSINSGKEQEIEGGNAMVSSDGQFIATGDATPSIIYIYDSHNLLKKDSILIEGIVGLPSMFFSSKADRLLINTGEKIVVKELSCKEYPFTYDYLHDNGYGTMVSDEVTSASYSSDSKYVVSACSNKYNQHVVVWESSTGIKTNEFHVKSLGGIVDEVEMSPQTNKIAISNNNGKIVVLDLKNGEETILNHSGGNLSWKTNDVLLLTDDSIYEWSVYENKKKESWNYKTNFFKEFLNVYYGDNRYIAGRAGAYNQNLVVWDLTRQRGLMTVKAYPQISRFSPDGTLLGTISDSILNVFNVHNGNIVLERKTPVKSKCHAISFDTGSNRIAIAYENGTIEIIDLKGQLVYVLKDEIYYNDSFASIMFSPDNSRLLTVRGQQLKEWYCPPLQKLIDKTQERFKKRKLTAGEKQKYYLE